MDYMRRRFRRYLRRLQRSSDTRFRFLIGAEMLIIVILLVSIFGGLPKLKIPFFSGKPSVKSLDISDINSTYGLLMQADNGRILGEKNGEEIAYPASLTKVMTVILAIEKAPGLKHKITLTNEMVEDLYQRDASQAGFLPGETVTVKDLLYGAMLPSGAECCRALCYDLAGSEEQFVELMNKKAQKIGMKNTHFCNSIGLHDPDHYSTAEDMAILMQYALKNKTFREILKSPWHTSAGTNLHPDGITYYSSFLKSVQDPAVTGGTILGGKTGFTSQAGLCLASAAEIEGRDYILITMGAWYNGENYEDAKTVYQRLGEALKK